MTALIFDDYNDNEHQELQKIKKKSLDPTESAKKRSILRDLILSFLVVGSVGNSTVPWTVLAPVSTNTTRSSPEATIFYIAKDVAQIITSPFVGGLIDKIGPDIPYLCGGITMFLSTVTLAFSKKPVFLLFARISHGIGSAFTEISTITIIANMFTTTIVRSKCLGLVTVFASFGLYLIVRRVDLAVLLLLACMPLVNGIAAFRALFKLKAEEAKEFQTTKSAPISYFKILIDPYIMICAGALTVSNIPLVFFLRTVQFDKTNGFFDFQIFTDDTAVLLFFAHTLGIAAAVQLTIKFSNHRWLITLVGLILEGVSCFAIAFIDSKISLELIVSIIAFSVGMVRAAVLPTFACIMEIRHAPIYGSVYAIASQFYSLAFVVSPMVGYLYLGPVGFTTIAVSMGLFSTMYAPILYFVRRF